MHRGGDKVLTQQEIHIHHALLADDHIDNARFVRGGVIHTAGDDLDMIFQVAEGAQLYHAGDAVIAVQFRQHADTVHIIVLDLQGCGQTEFLRHSGHGFGGALDHRHILRCVIRNHSDLTGRNIVDLQIVGKALVQGALQGGAGILGTGAGNGKQQDAADQQRQHHPDLAPDLQQNKFQHAVTSYQYIDRMSPSFRPIGITA